MPVTELKNAEELNEVFKGGKPIFLKFYATWCGPCRQSIPVVNDLSEKNPTLGFYEMDVDEVSDVAEKYGVEMLPCFIIAADDKIVSKVDGREWPEIEKNIAAAVEVIASAKKE